jgi:hypothetical protein
MLLLAVALGVPAALAAQSHGLWLNDRVRIQYAGLDGSHVVEGKVRSLTEDTLAVKTADASTRRIAWTDVERASRWGADAPRRDAIVVLGGSIGAVIGGFFAASQSESGSSGGQLQAKTIVVRGAEGFVVGALVGVGASYLVRTHSWHSIRIPRAVAIHLGPRARGARWRMGLSLSVPVGGR